MGLSEHQPSTAADESAIINALCHCGQVVLKVPELPGFINSCNCSICYRLGALWGYYDADSVDVSSKFGTTRYAWGGRQIEFHRCTCCGCTTHFLTVLKNGSHRIAINMRMVPVADIEGIPVRLFDGADTWRFLDGPSSASPTSKGS